MKQAPWRLLLVAALAALPTTLLSQDAWAQKKDGKADPKKGDPKKGADVEDLGGDDTPEPKKDDKKDEPGGSTSGANIICETNPEACNTDKLIKDYSEKDLRDSQIYAVQQIYALRRGRVELSPYWAASLNDQFVSHPGPGIALNYYVTNVLGVGFNANLYQPFNSDAEFNKQVRQSTRLAIPINEYRFGVNLNFSYVPLYGKFAGFGDFIFHWDAYVVGGIGAISTRPKASIDPENRGFEWKTKVAFNVGICFRVFFNRWLAAFLEIRDYAYSEPLENIKVEKQAPPGTPVKGTAKDPDTWYGESRFTNAVQAQFGLSIFLPVTWQYRLPK